MPGLQFSDRLSLQWQFDVLVTFVRVPEGVSQKGHADLSGDAEFKQAGIEGVSQVMELDVADSCSADCCLPAGFETSDCFAFKGEDQTGVSLVAGE